MDRIVVTLIAVTTLSASAFAGSDTYLALGDSVPFGMNILLVPPFSQTIPKPTDFIGFPEIAAAAMKLSVLNASCPGETSGSFRDKTALDNGCNGPHLVPPPTGGTGFRNSVGLKTAYTGSQMQYAIDQLKTNKSIKLVSLTIGADDVLLVLPQLTQCGPDPICANNVLSPVLNSYAANLVTILAGIRKEYMGTLLLMTYYSPDPLLDGVAVALNTTMTQVAAQLSATKDSAPITIADGFAAFQLASASANHNACQAGLLIPLPPFSGLPPCDIHPSESGRDLLALLVEQVTPPSGSACNGFYSGTFVGNVKVSTGQTCVFVGGGVTGNVTQAGGNLLLFGATVTGNVQIQGSSAFSMGTAARINGDLQIQNLPASTNPNQVCGVTIGGNMTYHDAGAPVSIGSATPMCLGNTVGGDLQVHNNTGNVDITRNTVQGNLQIQNDTGSTGVFSNTIRKNLQCSGNSTIAGSGNKAAQKSGQCAAF